jgi:uncharacterized protein YggE
MKVYQLCKGAWLPRSFTLSTINFLPPLAYSKTVPPLLLLAAANSGNLAAMKTLVVCAFALVPLTMFAENAEVMGLTGLPNQPFLYVEGEASTQKPPDIIRMSFGVSGHNPDEGKANQEVQAKAKKIFALLKEAKIEDRDVAAQDVRSEREYAEDDADQTNKRGKLIGYVVTRSFELTVRDATKYGKLGDQIMALGDVYLSHISGEVSGSDKIGEELWPKAIADAREKAEKTLKPMGMKIDTVFAVSSIFFGEISGEFFKHGHPVIVTGMNVPTTPDQPSEYRPEMVTIESTAHVIYLISPAK